MIKFVLNTKSINTILYHHRMMSKDFSQFYKKSPIQDKKRLDEIKPFLAIIRYLLKRIFWRSA